MNSSIRGHLVLFPNILSTFFETTVTRFRVVVASSVLCEGGEGEHVWEGEGEGGVGGEGEIEG